MRTIHSGRTDAGEKFQDEGVFIGFLPDLGRCSCAGKGFWIGESLRSCVAFEGEIYNREEILRLAGAGTEAEALFNLYRKHGSHFLKRINGAFSLAVWDGVEKTLLVARDAIGIYQAFFRVEGDGLAFSSRLFPMADFRTGSGLSTAALLEYLVFCYNIGEESFYPGIRRLRPGHFLKWNRSGYSKGRYWSLDFDPDNGLSEQDAIEAIRVKLQESVRMRMRPSNLRRILERRAGFFDRGFAAQPFRGGRLPDLFLQVQGRNLR